jgi:Na+/H+ antiporter NhaA
VDMPQAIKILKLYYILILCGIRFNVSLSRKGWAFFVDKIAVLNRSTAETKGELKRSNGFQ